MSEKLTCGLIFAFGLAVAGCGTKDSGSSSAPATRNAAAAPTAPPAADATLKADDLVKELNSDSAAAVAKYANKELEVSGVISDLSVSHSSGDALIRLAGDPPDCLECWLTNPNPWGKVSVGQTITYARQVQPGDESSDHRMRDHRVRPHDGRRHDRANYGPGFQGRQKRL